MLQRFTADTPIENDRDDCATQAFGRAETVPNSSRVYIEISLVDVSTVYGQFNIQLAKLALVCLTYGQI